MTGKSIAIVDPDPCYSKSLSERLSHYLPGSSIARYSPSALRGKRESISENIILYDNKEICPDFFSCLTVAALLPILIPLRGGNDQGDARLSGNILAERIITAGTESSDSVTAAPSVCNQSGNLRLFLSLGSRTARENYIRANTGTLLSSGHRLIRLDMMPGIGISEPRSSLLLKRPGNQVFAGLSDLLLRLPNPELIPETLLEYLRPNGAGWLYFGRPSRSDDMVTLDPSHLVRLVKMLRLLVDRSSSPTSAIVVVEGLAFSKIRQICPLAHEMHVIFPEDAANDDPLIRYELEQLFQASGPKQLKFISSTGREAI